MGRRRWAAVLVAAMACALNGASAAEFPGLSAVAQNGLPTPPMQRSPWKPPAGGPGDVFAGAVAVIFDAGLPDPRGCEYRQVSVPRLLLAGRMQFVQTHGWVLPAGAGAQQFAICWDGLIYPVAAVGNPADLKADAAAALRQEETLLTEFETANPGRQYSTLWDPQGPGQAVSPDGALPLRACLLLRLGEADLATQLWQAAMLDYGSTMSVAINRDDPYLVFAVEWAWARYERALVYHCRGIAPLAMAELKGLDGLAQRLVDQASGRGFSRSEAHGFLAFLDDVPTMLAEQQQPRSIPDLIHDLPDVHLEPHSVPLTLDYADSPTMVELVLHGSAAVDPLLHAMSEEDRLSRTGTYGQAVALPDTPMPVRALEAVAVRAILGNPPLPDMASLRTWWEANKDRPTLERYYATLADNDAAPDMWFWAARRIVQPSDEALEPVERLSPPPATYTLRTGAPQWAGEPLRDERQPSVSDLMARRALALSQMGQAEDNRFGRLEDATRMAVLLARWDPPAARQPLATLQRSWHDLLGGRDLVSSDRPDVGRALANLAIARLRAGDKLALADYAAWVQAGYTRDTRPLWLSPQDPAAVSATTRLIEHMDVPEGADRLDGAFAPGSPMLAVEPFRDYVLKGLRDTEALGNVRIDDDLTVRPQYHGWTGPMPLERPDPGAAVPVRVCDSYAWNLSRLAGFPTFDPFASLEQRDRAIAECARIIEAKGADLSKAVDTAAFWAQWLRGHGEPDDLLADTAFNPGGVLQGG